MLCILQTQQQQRKQTSSLQTHLPQTQSLCISRSRQHAHRVQVLFLCRSLHTDKLQPTHGQVLNLDIVKKRPSSSLDIYLQGSLNMVVDAFSASRYLWQVPTPPEMTKTRLPSMAVPSGPLTPPVSVCGSSRRSSEDRVSAEALMSMASSASSLVDLNSYSGFDSCRGSTCSSVASSFPTERLPSFSEVTKGVPSVYTQWRTDPNAVGLAT